MIVVPAITVRGIEFKPTDPERFEGHYYYDEYDEEGNGVGPTTGWAPGGWVVHYLGYTGEHPNIQQFYCNLAWKEDEVLTQEMVDIKVEIVKLTLENVLEKHLGSNV